MSKLYVLRGRTERKTVTDETADPLQNTFSEIYTTCDAAMQALRAHLHDQWGWFSDENAYIDPADLHLPRFRGAQFGWYFNTFDAPTKEAPLVAEWVMTPSEHDDGTAPVLPYFAVEEHELPNA